MDIFVEATLQKESITAEDPTCAQRAIKLTFFSFKTKALKGFYGTVVHLSYQEAEEPSLRFLRRKTQAGPERVASCTGAKRICGRAEKGERARVRIFPQVHILKAAGFGKIPL